MLKTRKAAYLIIVVLLCWSMTIPTYAAVYDIADFYSYATVDNATNTKTAYYVVDTTAYSILMVDGKTVADGYDCFVYRWGSEVGRSSSIYTYHFGTKLYTGADAYDGVLDVSDIMDGAEIAIDADFTITYDTASPIPMSASFQHRTFVIAYDANMKFISQTSTNWTSSALPSEGVVDIENNVDYVLPPNTFYIGAITQTNWNTGFDQSSMEIQICPRPIDISVDVNMIYQQSQSMDRIEAQLGDIGGQLGSVNDKLDGILNQPAQEKEDASQGASDALSGAIDVVPDHSADLVQAFSGLATSLSYDGTVAQLAIPAVEVPGIDGLFDSFVVLDVQTFDFSTYFQMLPADLLLLVQSLFTAALIIFCFKELYSTIQYAMTLKG